MKKIGTGMYLKKRGDIFANFFFQCDAKARIRFRIRIEPNCFQSGSEIPLYPFFLSSAPFLKYRYRVAMQPIAKPAMDKRYRGKSHFS
jgi:hypothetical protein